MALRVIDIAWPYQDGISIEGVDCDAVIVKATGGNWFTNPKWREWADRTLGSGKLLGLYHYCMEDGVYSSPEDEARHFLDTVGDYARRAAIFLDWEADAQDLPVSYARRWLDIVAEETGATPFFYAYAYYLNSRDHSEIARYPLWMASYLDRYGGAGWVDDPVNFWGTGSWARMTAYQYTSTGHIGGYGGDLDLSVFYGTRGDWERMEGKMATNANMVDLLMPISTRYVFGGSRYEPYDTDCSGMVCAAFYKVHGVDPYALGDWTGAQWSRGVLRKIWWGTTPDLPYDEMEKGDVIFTSTTAPSFDTGQGSHVGFYTGDPARPFLSHYADGGPFVTAVDGVYGGYERYFGVARYEEGADMQPSNVWEYNYRDSAVGGNMYNAVNGMAQAVLEPHESSAGDGTSGSMRDRLEWVDMRVREMHEGVAEIKAAIANAPSGGQAGPTMLSQEDVDAIAEALADKLAKRIAD